MSPLNDRQTLAHLVRVCAAGSLSALFLATPLWMGTREEVPRFPLTEAFVSVERPIFFTLFVALGALLFIPFSRALLVLVCVCFSALVAGDVIRLHPWVLQCTLLFGVSACLLGRTREKNLLGFFALVVGGIYFWSGINKLNYGFVAGEFPVLLGPSSESLPPELIAVTGLCAAVFEMIAGGLLLIGKARRFAAVVLMCMHLFILIVIGPLGHNYNRMVWPWNVMMIGLLALLYFRATPACAWWSFSNPMLAGLVSFIVVILPSARLLGSYPAYLSWELYSGRDWKGSLELAAEEISTLPADLRSQTEIVEGKGFVNLGKYVEQRLGAPPWPERWAYIEIARRVCIRTGSPASLRLILKPPAPPLMGRPDGKEFSIGCGEIVAG